MRSCSPTPTYKQPLYGCQPDEPQASLATTNRCNHVYVVLFFILLFMYAVIHCLYSVGNKITTTTTKSKTAYIARRMEQIEDIRGTVSRHIAEFVMHYMYRNCFQHISYPFEVINAQFSYDPLCLITINGFVSPQFNGINNDVLYLLNLAFCWPIHLRLIKSIKLSDDAQLFK